MTKQAIIYCRFSPRPDADTSKSNEQQRLRCSDYCRGKSYEIPYIFYDDSVSGSTILRRGLSCVFAHLKPGMILVVDTPDRLARDLLVDLTIRKQIADLGCTLEFADGSPNTETPEGELMHDIMAAFASYERKKFARRTKAGMVKKKADGVWCGRPPYGWRKIKGIDKLVRNDIEQRVISEVWKMHQQGIGSTEIAATMTFRGQVLSARTIRRILSKSRS